MGLINRLLGKKDLPTLIYAIQVPAIAANANKVYRLHEQPLAGFAEDYAPFNGFTIQNTSSAKIKVIFNYNPNNFLYCVSGGTQIRKNQNFCNFNIINLETTTAINDSELIVWIEKT